MTQLLSVNPYQILEVSGSPSEKGFKYGSHHAALIKRLLNSHYEFYSTYFNTFKDEALGIASKYIQPTRDYSEDIAQELQGVAEGAGLKMEEVMMIAAFNEVFYPKLAGPALLLRCATEPLQTVLPTWGRTMTRESIPGWMEIAPL